MRQVFVCCQRNYLFVLSIILSIHSAIGILILFRDVDVIQARHQLFSNSLRHLSISTIASPKSNQYSLILSSIANYKHNKIYHHPNPSASMQAKTSTAFPHIESKTQPYSHKIAVLSAVNKLKEAQQKLLQAKHRQVVQKRIEQSILAREKEKKKNQFFKKMVRNSVDIDKQQKQLNQTKKQKQIQKLHELNLTFRESKFRFRQTVKSMDKQHKHQVYEQAKTQRQKNQDIVKEFKIRQLQLKKTHRQRMAERQEKSKERVDEFRQSRIFFIQKERQKDVEELQKKISTKTKYLEKFIESQNDFANSRTRMRYKSNSSFHKDGEKSQSEMSTSNLGKIVENVRINSMINPEQEVKEDIFGLTESKKEKTITPGNESEKENVSAKSQVVQNMEQTAVLKQETKEKTQQKHEEVVNKIDAKEQDKIEQKVKTIQQQIVDSSAEIVAEEAKKDLVGQLQKVELGRQGEKGEKGDQTEKQAKLQNTPIAIKAQGFKPDSLKQNAQN